MSVVLKIKRQNPADDLELPSYQTSGAAGMDVRSSETLTLQPGETALVATGFCLEIPAGFEVQLRPRSGLALKHSITLLNSPGTVDADFRGEVKILLSNFGKTAFPVERGERIAQMVVARVERAEFEIVTEIAVSERGQGGFGHTGT